MTWLSQYILVKMFILWQTQHNYNFWYNTDLVCVVHLLLTLTPGQHLAVFVLALAKRI